MKWFIRGLYFFLVAFYIYALIDEFAYLPFSILRIIKWVMMSVLWNIGIYLVTLEFFRKRKFLGFLIFLPTLITSPLLLPIKYGVFHWGCLILLFGIMLNYLLGESMRVWPPALKGEAKKEAYKLIDKYLRKLPKNADGTFNEFAEGFNDNDVDALRHAYVSGVFTQEYNETAADIFGRLNEYALGGGSSSSNSTKSTNMDLWNNAVGRKYGKKSKTRKELFKKLMKALKNGELIIDPENDTRKYLGAGEIKELAVGMVIVLDENKNGKNRIFYDLGLKKVMSKAEFVTDIKNGNYPNYELRVIRGDEIPASKKDGVTVDNLG